MNTKIEQQRPDQPKIKIVEYRHGAFSGEFPTIIVVLVLALAQGVMGAIGKDIWKKLKEYLKRRFQKLEQDRQSKRGTRKPRSRVLCVYIVTHLDTVPLIYYSKPTETGLSLDFNHEELLKAEQEIQALIRAGKINNKKFLGINLERLGKGACFSIFNEIPSQEMMDGPNAFTPHNEKTIEEIKKSFRGYPKK